MLDLLTLTFVPGVGPARLRALIAQYGSVGEAAARVATEEARALAEKELAEAKSLGVQLLSEENPLYPKSFSLLKNPPPILYVLGDPQILSQVSVAVVGTRSATPYGLEMARKVSKELAEEGIVVVSGLARGIDTAAHLGALEGGKTVAVIGSGFQKIYPQENGPLARKIAETGALLSPFSLHTPPEKYNFPRRNHLVSALTLATVVVEAPLKSGAMLTAENALAQKKKLFALPGRADSENFAGNLALLKSGKAQLITETNDLFAALEIQRKTLSSPPKTALSTEERTIMQHLKNEEVCYDLLIEATGLPTHKINVLLMSLILKKIIVELPGKLYRKA